MNGCATELHRELGAGLLESTYEQGLADELKMNSIESRCSTCCRSHSKVATRLGKGIKRFVLYALRVFRVLRGEESLECEQHVASER